MNGQSQAVRLPSEFRFEGKEVYAQKVKNGVLLIAMEDPWIIFKKSLNMFSEYFMCDRQQPKHQLRDESSKNSKTYL